MSNAEDAASVCRGAGGLEALGRCLSTYWEQKKRMAPGGFTVVVRPVLTRAGWSRLSFFVVQKFANVLPVPVLQARACTQRPKCPRAACRAERRRYSSSASPTFRGARNTLKSIVGHRHNPGPSRARYLRAELLPAGAEPPAVKALLDKLRPLCYGLSVCGAGGGGFVACITKNPGDQARRGVVYVVCIVVVVVVVAFMVVGWWYSISSSVLCQTVFMFRTSRFGCVLRVLSGAAYWEGKHPPSEEGNPPD